MSPRDIAWFMVPIALYGAFVILANRPTRYRQAKLDEQQWGRRW